MALTHTTHAWWRNRVFFFVNLNMTYSLGSFISAGEDGADLYAYLSWPCVLMWFHTEKSIHLVQAGQNMGNKKNAHYVANAFHAGKWFWSLNTSQYAHKHMRKCAHIFSFSSQNSLNKTGLLAALTGTIKCLVQGHWSSSCKEKGDVFLYSPAKFSNISAEFHFTAPFCGGDDTSTSYHPANGTHATTCHRTRHFVLNLSEATGLRLLMARPHWCQDVFMLGEASQISWHKSQTVIIIVDWCSFSCLCCIALFLTGRRHAAD